MRMLLGVDSFGTEEVFSVSPGVPGTLLRSGFLFPCTILLQVSAERSSLVFLCGSFVDHNSMSLANLLRL